jgi:hypothetical protein
MKDQVEVCLLSHGMMLPVGAIPIRPITDGIRFLHYPLPTAPLACLAVAYRFLGAQWVYRVSPRYLNGLGPLYSPVALIVHEGSIAILPTRHVAFWLKPVSIFGLFWVTTFIKRSHMLTIPFNPCPRSALMLADPGFASRLS